MLLLSNLSLQILDSEKQTNGSVSRWLQPKVPRQTPEKHTAAVLPRGWGQKCRGGWVKTQLDSQSNDTVGNSTSCSVGSSSLDLGSLILSAFPPPSTISSLLRSLFKEDWSLFHTIHPSSGSGMRGTQGKAGSFRREKSYHNGTGTLTRFKGKVLMFIKPRSLAGLFI